jgi:hypothetical protein
MRNWLLRGLVFAAVMIAVRLVQGMIINAWPTQAALVSVSLLLLFALGVVLWSVLDGRADALTNPDPDRRQDLAMTWLLAGLVAGILSGAICWLISQLYTGLYTGGFLNEVTTFAAFTALVVFLPAVIGTAVGRWRVDRNPPPRRDGGAADERADTDVFSAVRAGDAATGESEAAGAAQHRAQGRAAAPTALAERPQSEQEAPTAAIPATEDDAKTEVLDLDLTKPTELPKPQPEPKLPSGPWGTSEKP